MVHTCNPNAGQVKAYWPLGLIGQIAQATYQVLGQQEILSQNKDKRPQRMSPKVFRWGLHTHMQTHMHTYPNKHIHKKLGVVIVHGLQAAFSSSGLHRHCSHTFLI